MAIDTTYLDSGSDQIRLARPALLEAVQKLNTLVEQVFSATAAPFLAKGDGVTDNWAALNYADAVAAATGRRVYLPAGRYLCSKTLVLKASWYGDGTENKWTPDGRGTIIETMGAGNPARWTDIDGTDASTFTPFVVMGRSDSMLSDMTVKCGGTRWSAGVYVPGTKRNTLRNVDAVGQWKAAGLYLDATWSSSNATLTTLHPEVESDTGLNEFSVTDCFLEGLWGFQVQGTTRDASTFTGTWVWAPGGTSDLSAVNLRMGSCSAIPVAERIADGGGFKHDAALQNAALAGQGHNFVNCTIRTKSKYTVFLDRSNRDMWVNTYAETVSGNDTGTNAVFAITSNTGTVNLINDNMGGPITFNGVQVADGTSSYRWASTRRLSISRAFGSSHLPYVYGGMSTGAPLELISGEADGTVQFSQNTNDGSYATTPYLRVYNGGFRPEVAYGCSIGTTGFPFLNVTASEGRFATLQLGGVPVVAPVSGVWTPVLSGSTTAGTNVYTTQSGDYVKVGNLVYLSGALAITGLVDGAMGGNMQIGGLPFPCKSGSATWAAATFSRILATNLTASTQLAGQLSGGVSVIGLFERGNTGDVVITSVAKFGSGFQIRFSITYVTA